MITFQEQAVQYMQGLQNSRKTRRPSTLRAYQSYLDAHLNPQIGSRSLESLTNAAAKEFFSRIADELSASMINGIFNVFKGVIASAINQNGDQIYPRTWNKSFIDLPTLVPAKQNTPEIPPDSLSRALLSASPADRLLWAFLAGSGLRVGECLAVCRIPDGTGNYWDQAAGTVTVEVQRDLRHPEDAHRETKTEAGQRIVDLSRDLNEFLIRTAPQGDFLFTGKYDGLLRRLKKALPDAGFHSFRRFRITQVGAKNTPITLDHFWAGHAAEDVHERYAKWATKHEERRAEAERVGLGFELPA